MDKDSKDSIDVEIETAEPIKSVDDSVNEENPQLSEIEKLKAEVASWEDKFLRTHAHFENSKKLLADKIKDYWQLHMQMRVLQKICWL